MNELIEKIIFDAELSDEQKARLIIKVTNASHGIDRLVTDGFYLHAQENRKTGAIDIKLWYRNEDPSGMIQHGDTHYDTDAILAFMKKHSLTKGNVK